MDIEFTTADEAEIGDATSGVRRKMAFSTEDCVMVKPLVSGWTGTEPPRLKRTTSSAQLLSQVSCGADSYPPSI